MNRRQRSLRAALVALAVGLVTAGPAGAADPPKAGGPDIQSAQAEKYDGPKARIAVKDFEDKMSSSGHYRAEYGRGMRDMLTTALFQTNRYIVLEREKLGAVMDELKQGASDLFRKEATVPLGELEGAELLVTAAITGFDPGASGGGGNIGGRIPGLGGVLGGIGIGFKKASIAMDLRVIDVRTGRVVAATNAQGEASTFAAGLGGIGGGMGGSLGGFSKTPMESAIRDMIQKTVDFVVTKTPPVYYRHGGTAAAPPPGGAAPAAAPPAAPSAVAGLAPGGAPAGAPPQPKALQTVRSDFDNDLVARLTDVTLRGAVLSVVVSLTLEGSKAQSEKIELVTAKSHVLDYATGQTYPVITADGFTAGQLKSGEVKTLRVTFRAPKDAKAVGINLSGVGSFDDVKLGP